MFSANSGIGRQLVLAAAFKASAFVRWFVGASRHTVEAPGVECDVSRVSRGDGPERRPVDLEQWSKQPTIAAWRREEARQQR